jgi:mRNA-binding protein PUF3
MKDVFGNYVVQKLFDHCNQIQKTLLAQAMKGWVVSLSVHPYACRVLQKVPKPNLTYKVLSVSPICISNQSQALEHILVEQQREIVKELEVDALKVIKDQHGNHVIQKALECVPRQYIGFIFDSLRGNVKELACHNYACRVLQRAIDHGNADDKASIIEEVHKSCPELIDDQYGNYVVQHVLEKGGLEDRTRIINTILGDVVHLSKQKHASNVVEKCAECGTREQVLQIEEEMIMAGPDGISPLRTMITDQYANFVIRKFLPPHTLLKHRTDTELEKHAKWTPDKQAYFRALRPHLEWAQSSYNGKHVQAIAEMLKGIDSPAPLRRATPSSGGPVSTAPASPLQLDVGSAAPTPNLTMEPNSPARDAQSSTPESARQASSQIAKDTGRHTPTVIQQSGVSHQNPPPILSSVEAQSVVTDASSRALHGMRIRGTAASSPSTIIPSPTLSQPQHQNTGPPAKRQRIDNAA